MCVYTHTHMWNLIFLCTLKKLFGIKVQSGKASDLTNMKIFTISFSVSIYKEFLANTTCKIIISHSLWEVLQSILHFFCVFRLCSCPTRHLFMEQRRKGLPLHKRKDTLPNTNQPPDTNAHELTALVEVPQKKTPGRGQGKPQNPSQELIVHAQSTLPKRRWDSSSLPNHGQDHTGRTRASKGEKTWDHQE